MLKRVVTKYEKRGDERLVAEYPLRASARDVRDLFRRDDDDPQMVLVYRVRPLHKRYLEEKLRAELDLRSYDYFVECYEVPASKRPSRPSNGTSSVKTHSRKTSSRSSPQRPLTGSRS